MQKLKKTSEGSSMMISSGIGLILMACISMILVLVSAVFINNEYFTVSSIRYLAVAIQFLSVLVGAFAAGKIANQKKAMACLISAGGFLLLQICCGMLFFEGISSGVAWGLIATAVAAVCDIFLCGSSKMRSGSKRKRNRYR